MPILRSAAPADGETIVDGRSGGWNGADTVEPRRLVVGGTVERRHVLEDPAHLLCAFLRCHLRRFDRQSQMTVHPRCAN